MTSLSDTTFITPELKIGLGGNYYVVCDDKEMLIPICEEIDKSVNSIYFNKKYNCWAIRVKAKSVKQKLGEIL